MSRWKMDVEQEKGKGDGVKVGRVQIPVLLIGKSSVDQGLHALLTMHIIIPNFE